MTSLCFLHPIVFVGRYIDSDVQNKSDEIQKLEWEGFLKDEYIHHNLGYVQISLFGITLFLAVVSILIPN